MFIFYLFHIFHPVGRKLFVFPLLLENKNGFADAKGVGGAFLCACFCESGGCLCDGVVGGASTPNPSELGVDIMKCCALGVDAVDESTEP